MKRNLYLVFFAACFLCSNAFATLEAARDKYKTMHAPLNSKDTVHFIARDTSFYTPNSTCGQVSTSNFTVTNLRIKNEYYWQSKSETGSLIDHFHCLFRIVEVTYEVKCQNGLYYEGKEYLLGTTKKRNEAWSTNSQSNAFKAEAHDWQKHPLESLLPDGTIVNENGRSYNNPIEKLDENRKREILARWLQQIVSYPEYTFTGTPGKLPRPVLLVHGLGGNYGQWGVKTYDKIKNRSEFKNGQVQKNGYENGSLPDLLARSNNLNTADSASINSNGIYFFQAADISFPHWSISPSDTSLLSSLNLPPESAALLQMNMNVPLPSPISQSRDLYNKIASVMDDFYQKQNIDWRSSNAYQIDLVGHSQGGLVIREMLRGLRDNPGSVIETGVANAANHINRVITVNTPHFGSVLATPLDKLNEIEQDFYGIARLIEDIDNPKDTSHDLIKAKLSMNFWEKNRALYNYAGIGLPATSTTILGCIYSVVLCVIYTEIVSETDAYLTLKGPYIGPYEPILEIRSIVKKTIKPGLIEALSEFSEMLKDSRKAEHLYKKGPFMTRLNNNYNNFFPLRPDGSKITMLPMYSDSTHRVLPELLGEASEEADRLCSRGENNPNCFAIGLILKEYIYNMSVKEKGAGFKFSEPEFDNEFWKVLQSLYSDWLTQSDMVVESSSQKFVSSNNLPDNVNFLEPRPYAIRSATSYDPIVVHGPFGKPPISKYRNAPQQGHDLLCALSPACDNAYVRAMQSGRRRAVIRLSDELAKGTYKERSVEIAGDLDVAPIYTSEGLQGLSVSANGETILTAQYEPGKGSSIDLEFTQPIAQPASQDIMPLAMNAPATLVEQSVVVGPEIATQPAISRKGDSISISFMNYSGKAFKKDYFLPGLPNNLTISVIAESNAVMSPVIVGNATAANLETQKPPTPPPSHHLAPITLAALHREARGEHETNTSRPRFLVYNNASDTLEFSKVAYYFTADPARMPKVVVDYPQVPVSVENLGGDQWRFVLDVGNQKIAPKTFYPSADGWQIRVHYSDWFEYKHLDDWSADYSLGQVQLNRKIVIYDRNDKIIWGNEAPGFENEDNGIIPAPKGTLAWQDDAPWETNTFKPRVTVKNIGSIALSDYHAQLWFRVPQGKNLHIPAPNAWYTPESQTSARNVGGRVWMLDMHFNKHILYPDASVSEGNIGLNLTDWSTFDKIVCGIALKDKDGNILFGREPSVEECESYKGPDFLLAFTMRNWN
ncbi:MAG: hypothetical protein LBU89_01775 [Fibromonadaceae bacterium]|jgi:pimeloyl-ACP methyl ester carboxylesterase|nr:hypothetical protein [Fibromonadaceae bacterium]